jgi:hypothetical protein
MSATGTASLLIDAFALASVASIMQPDSMRAALEGLVARLPPPYVIPGADGSPYLLRYTVAELLDGSCVFLHRFMRSDEDKELHSHPWSGTSIILLNGYREERRVVVSAPWDRRIYGIDTRIYVAGDTSHLRGDTFHRVDLLAGDCWTLFCAGPKDEYPEGVDSWSFWDRDTGKTTPWRTFIAAKGLTPRTTPRTVLRPLVKAVHR